jgi:GMP synthase (glutamine-hydrolysing)
LGVCLGSQMIAAALGAAVYPGPVREVGFSVVSVLDPASPLRHVVDVPVLHWHGDTFDLPAGVERLAESTHYANQAFRIDEWLLALQFHPEMGEDPRIENWLADHDYIKSAGTDADTVRADHDRLGPGAVAAGRALLGEWLAGLNGRKAGRGSI